MEQHDDGYFVAKGECAVRDKVLHCRSLGGDGGLMVRRLDGGVLIESNGGDVILNQCGVGALSLFLSGDPDLESP